MKPCLKHLTVLTDLRSLLATIVQIVVDRDRLQQVIFSLHANEAYYANFSVANSLRQFARHTLLVLEFATSFNSHGYSKINFISNMDFIFYTDMP